MPQGTAPALFEQGPPMQVIRCGRKIKQSTQWSTFDILKACWELDEQMGRRPNPLTAIPDTIPQLNPIPQKPQERSDQGDHYET